MKYNSLKNAPNVSRSGVAISPSLSLDDRGFPHIVWLDEENGSNEVNYSFWDGLKWSYKDLPQVYISAQEIVHSPNSLSLSDEFSPYIAFARKTGSGYRLSLANYSNKWNFNELDVDYSVGWVGVVKPVKFERQYSTSSSSSSSSSSSTLIMSTSSSMSSIYSVSSFSSSSSSLSSYSSASESSSQSQSSMTSSSSSSIDSSSSLDDARFFVVVYDTTNHQFKIYGVTEFEWRLKGLINFDIDAYSAIKISACGYTRKLGISVIDNNLVIQYNFFDLQIESWLFPVTFNVLMSSQYYGGVIDMDVVGYNINSISVMGYSWLSRTSSSNYVNGVILHEDGTEIALGGSNITLEESTIDVVVDSGYLVNGYTKIAMCLGALDVPYIIATGISNKMFQLVGGVWQSEFVNIYGVSNGIVVNSIEMQYYDSPNVAISANSGDIYYFESDYENTFGSSTPDLAILTDTDIFHSTFSVGQLSGHFIDNSSNIDVANILTDSIKPLFVGAQRKSTRDIIRTIDLDNDSVKFSRDIYAETRVGSIDVNQITGQILVTHPAYSWVVIHSQGDNPIYISSVGGDLNYPLDAKFDYLRRKIWIADSGNNRVVSYDMDIGDATIIIPNVIYPHALAVDLVNGGVFVKGYSDIARNNECIYHYKIDGVLVSSFEITLSVNSSSSSSSLNDYDTSESVIANSICYDHVRNRVWWINSSTVCVVDESIKQVKTLGLSSLGFNYLRSIDVEYSTGNVFIAGLRTLDSQRRCLIEVSRDNNAVLGYAYVYSGN